MTNSQGMNSDVIPERTWIEQDITRAEMRMNAAKSLAWKYAWCGLMVRKINERNAMRSVAEVRAIERARGLR